MKALRFLSAGLLAITFLHSMAQHDTRTPTQVLVKTARLLDVRSGKFIENAAVLIDDDRIKEVGAAVEVQAHAQREAKVIDLGHAALLPGLIDCHTHLMARFADTPDGYLLGLATKSQAFRALEGAADARLTLNAGFTTVRDVENEGSGYADVALREAINQGLVEGPRMEVATRAIAAVGQYNPFGVSSDLTDFPTGAQMVSGVEEARRAVREQIGHGAGKSKSSSIRHVVRLKPFAGVVVNCRKQAFTRIDRSWSEMREGAACATPLFQSILFYPILLMADLQA